MHGTVSPSLGWLHPDATWLADLPGFPWPRSRCQILDVSFVLAIVETYLVMGQSADLLVLVSAAEGGQM